MMSIPKTDLSEAERLEALEELGVLDTPPEERFDRLTRLARRAFDVPIALVSLVDAHRQWFKSHDGIEASETPREWSFCSHAIQEPRTMIVRDASEDARFKDNPLVLEDPAIRFYAGQPVTAPNGAPIGTVCIIDREPRDLDSEEQALLVDIAHMVERELSAIRLATIDELTGLSNRRGFNTLARHSLAMCDRSGKAATLILFDLDGFKELNDTLGHAAGDAALASFAADLLANYRESDVVARLGGDEFCVLLSGATAEAAPATLDKLAERLAARNEGREDLTRIRYSAGSATYDRARHESIDDLVADADAAMYEDKRSRRSG